MSTLGSIPVFYRLRQISTAYFAHNFRALQLEVGCGGCNLPKAKKQASLALAKYQIEPKNNLLKLMLPL